MRALTHKQLSRRLANKKRFNIQLLRGHTVSSCRGPLFHSLLSASEYVLTAIVWRPTIKYEKAVEIAFEINFWGFLLQKSFKSLPKPLPKSVYLLLCIWRNRFNCLNYHPPIPRCKLILCRYLKYLLKIWTVLFWASRWMLICWFFCDQVLGVFTL